jgi:hypothetical protein
MNWIKDGANPLRLGLLSGLGTMALIVFSFI